MSNHVNPDLFSVTLDILEGLVMKQAHLERYRMIGLKISFYRKLRGLTQEELAEKIDRTPAFIGHVEAPNINKAISLDTLFDIADVLEIQPKKLIDFDDIS